MLALRDLRPARVRIPPSPPTHTSGVTVRRPTWMNAVSGRFLTDTQIAVAEHAPPGVLLPDGRASVEPERPGRPVRVVRRAGPLVQRLINESHDAFLPWIKWDAVQQGMDRIDVALDDLKKWRSTRSSARVTPRRRSPPDCQKSDQLSRGDTARRYVSVEAESVSASSAFGGDVARPPSSSTYWPFDWLRSGARRLPSWRSLRPRAWRPPS